MEHNVNWDEWKKLSTDLFGEDDKAEASIDSRKKISRPSLLWEIACDYFKHIDDNPWPDVDYRGKDADMVTYLRKMPYTWAGLNFYLAKHRIVADLDDYRLNTAGLYTNYLGVTKLIKQVMYEQKSSGATSGFFNANIIKAELGLIDRVESKIEAKVSQTVDYSKLSESALNEIAKQLNKNKDGD